MSDRETPPSRIAAVYEQWAGLKALAADEQDDERTKDDPFGLNTPYAPDPKDPWGRAKECAQRMLNFVNLLRGEFELSPKEVVFAMELTALNTYNLEDAPITPFELRDARKAAFDYYAAHCDP